MKVLIVDDSLIMRETLKSIMKSLGHESILAEDGTHAVKAYFNHSPDLVTMDITMPEMDGVTALKLIIKTDPKAKVIMSTSHGSEDTVLEAIKAGALAYILKPLTIEKVEDAINKIFPKDKYLNGLCDDM